MKTLASKDYAGQFPVTPDVTVLFLPSDAFLSAALEFDSSLLEDAMQRKIVIATPVSLFCLLKAVAYGWQQEAIAQNAQAISTLGKELHRRISVLWGHLDKLRNGLVSAVDSFDAMVGSIESRLRAAVSSDVSGCVRAIRAAGLPYRLYAWAICEWTGLTLRLWMFNVRS